MADHDPPIPAELRVRSFDDLMRVQADAAVALSQADRSTWNGRWDSVPGSGSRASWDGTIHYGSEDVGTLREMFADAGRPQDESTRIRYRTAVKAVLRENTRLLAPDGQDHSGSAAVGGHTWARVLDNGVAEAWSTDHLDEYIDGLGLDQVVPGIKNVQAVPEFAAETAAVRGLSEAAGEATGAGAEHLLGGLSRLTTPEKLELVTSMMYRGRCLHWLVPPHSRHVATTSVERAFREGLDRVDDVRGATQAEVRRGSQRQGMQAVRDAGTQVDALRTEHDNPQLMSLLARRQAEAAVAISGADHSSFNGVVGEADGTISEGVVNGVATWSGTMMLHNDRIVQPLREMYARAGEQHDEATLIGYRNALSTVLHENAHLLAPQGQHIGDAAQMSRHTWARYGEEGFTNAWTEQNLDAYIRELGIDTIAPGILEVDRWRSYPAYTPAAHAVAEGIGELTGGSAEVLRQINNETAVGKWGKATDLLYEASDLPALVPNHDVFHAKLSVEKAMRNGFAWLDENTGKGTVRQVIDQSSLRGAQALQAGRAQIRVLEGQYGSPDARALYQAAMIAHSGVAPPSAGGSGVAAATTNRPATSGRGTERPGGRDV